MEDSRAVSPAPAGTDPTHPDGDGALPLVLDVDGTLLRTDLLHETFWAALGRRPFATLRATFANLRRPARLKARLREIAMPEVETLPVNDAVLELAVRALDEGRPVHLASAADQVLVDAVGERFGLEGPHFGSDGNRNLKGSAKAQLLTERFGRGGYVYGGIRRRICPVGKARPGPSPLRRALRCAAGSKPWACPWTCCPATAPPAPCSRRCARISGSRTFCCFFRRWPRTTSRPRRCCR
ncbi:hypothetical protein ACFOHS_01030 [Jhaorihella thermophila]